LLAQGLVSHLGENTGLTIFLQSPNMNHLDFVCRYSSQIRVYIDSLEPDLVCRMDRAGFIRRPE
jgi:hypothetical protein